MSALKGTGFRPPTPDLMSAEERLDEVAGILAKGMARVMEKRKTEHLPLDKTPTIRPYGPKPTQGEGP